MYIQHIELDPMAMIFEKLSFVVLDLLLNHDRMSQIDRSIAINYGCFMGTSYYVLVKNQAAENLRFLF